ncbi:MAG: response regulator [Bacteroidetes bacterium]|nr:response regulator [Bacteroidota bacterium]
MNKSATLFCLLIATFWVVDSVRAQSTAPEGFPFTQTYRRGDFVGSPRTWGIFRADDGLLYFGNTRYGIQESDGLSWRNLRLERNSVALSFAQDQKGQIYVGGQLDFGFLQRDSLMSRKYHSLAYLLPDSASSIIDVEFTFVLNDIVHFVSPTVWYTYMVSDQKITWQKNDVTISSAVKWKESIISLHSDGTLNQTKDKTTKKITSPTSLNNPHLLFSNGKRLFLWDKSYTLWEFQADQTWNKIADFAGVFSKVSVNIHDFIWTDSGYIVFATSNGLYTFDQKGTYLYTMYASDGLADNSVIKLYQDSDWNVWMTSLFGVSKIEFGRGMREFLPSQGLPEQTGLSQEFNGTLYLGGFNGLYVWEKDRFKPIYEGSRVYAMEVSPFGMLIGSMKGLHLVDKKGIFHPIYTQGAVDIILPDRDNPKVVYFTHYLNSLRKVVLESEKTFQEFKLADHTPKSYTLTEDKNGELWIGTGGNGDFHFVAEQENDVIASITNVRQFTPANGLPSNGFNFTMSVGNDVGFITSNGFYRLNEKRDSIFIDQRFTEIFKQNDRSVWPVTNDKNGGIWLAWAAALIGKCVYNPQTDVFDWYDGEFTRAAPYRDIDFILPTDKNRIYFQTYQQKLAYYDSSLITKPLPKIRAHINSVILNKDSLLWQPRGFSETELTTPILFQDNKIRFNYGMIAFLPEDRLFYQIKLEGLDEDWLGNTNERYRDYTNLREGKYRFKVRGFSLYPDEAQIASFSFEILPPWYRTWWAYLFYVLFGLGSILGFVRFRERSLLKRQEELESEIQSRTEKIRQQNEQLEELDKVKSRFFSNVGHEFRTPLTIIKGLLDRTVKTELLPQSAVEKMMPVLRNVDRLSVMVEQVMALSSMDNRVMTVINEVLGADLVVTLCVESFRSLVDLKEQSITFEPQATRVLVEVDRNKMETVVNNLLSNAIKYNSKHGSIMVRTFQKGDMYEVQVDDTGRGINPSEHETIFERFHRIKQNEGNYVEGLGIGLDLSRAYAKALGGDVFVDPTYTTGARFVFRLPISTISEQAIEAEVDAKQVFAKSKQQRVVTDGSKKPRVLLVEDNMDMGMYLSEILRGEVHVMRVEHGQEALDWLENNTCDLIISDLMMPVMDGETFVSLLAKNERHKNIPVVVLTAKSNPEIRLRLLRIGVVDFINKPFNADELLLKIINLLGYVKTRQEYRTLLEAEEPEQNIIEQISDKIADYIIKNIQDSGLSPEILGQQFEISRRTLYRVIQAETGLTYAAFVKELRLQEAYKISISIPEISLKELATSVGYLDPNNFKKLFIERFGHGPGEVF